MTSSDTPTQPSMHQLTCEACRVIDRADGVEDGEVWNPKHFETPSTRDLISLMRRVQDRTADSITSIAGSMRFVYVHIVWFGVGLLSTSAWQASITSSTSFHSVS